MTIALKRLPVFSKVSLSKSGLSCYFFFSFWDRIPLCSPVCSGTLGDPSASASHMLELKNYTTTAQYELMLLSKGCLCTLSVWHSVRGTEWKSVLYFVYWQVCVWKELMVQYFAWLGKRRDLKCLFTSVSLVLTHFWDKSSGFLDVLTFCVLLSSSLPAHDHGLHFSSLSPGPPPSRPNFPPILSNYHVANYLLSNGPESWHPFLGGQGSAWVLVGHPYL